VRIGPTRRACGPARETEVGQQRSPSNEHADVIAVRELLTCREQALHARVPDGIPGVAERLARDTRGVERVVQFHAELTQHFRQVPDGTDACRTFGRQAATLEHGRVPGRPAYV
jgi:hypothetical protein